MWIFSLLIIFNFLWLLNSESICKLPNTGTVLFRNIDMHRKRCWSREELALVYTRRAVMELIPRQIPHNIPLILEYIHICLTTLKEIVPSKQVYDYMVAALADSFGGYLQTYGLPLLNEAYYEGYVSYDSAAEFYRIQENFKGVLMTNGEGWTEPMEVRKHINRILPLKLPALSNTKSCNLLSTSSVCEAITNESNSKTPVPLPILDDYQQPNSIAIPFKTRSLFNLKSRNSYDILIKYYLEASKCIDHLQKNGLEQLEFDRELSGWLKNKVFPHLKDETWYVGFSNVLRIEETIQQRSGMIGTSRPKGKEDSLFTELESEAQLTKATFIIVIVVTVLSIFFLFFIYCTCIKIICANYRGRNEEAPKGNEDSEGGDTDIVTLLDNSSTASGSSKGRVCQHEVVQQDLNYNGYDNKSHSGQTISEESRLTMSCGLGKGFPPFLRREHH